MKMRHVLMFCFVSLALPGCSSVGINRPAAGAAAGGTAPSSASASFIAADLDGDARISPREYDIRPSRDGTERQSFESADTNHDGVLTFDEWEQLMSPRRR